MPPVRTILPNRALALAQRVGWHSTFAQREGLDPPGGARYTTRAIDWDRIYVPRDALGERAEHHPLRQSSPARTPPPRARTPSFAPSHSLNHCASETAPSAQIGLMLA